MCEWTEPLVQKRKEISENKQMIEKILQQGQQKAQEVASQTMKEIKQAVKIGKI